MFTAPDSAYFCIFNFPIYYYGIILAFSILIGLLVSHNIAVKDYFIVDLIPKISTSIVLGGIIGARLYYCILNYNHYIKNPLEIFALREGGLSIHGAIIGGLIVLYIEAKKNNVDFLKLCDILSVGMPLAQSVGRWGNFFNSEAFGLPTNLPWGLYIKPIFRPEKYLSYEYFHPTFLYESIMDILIYIVLIKILLPKYKENCGVTAAFYLLLYSIVRFFIESLRVDCVKYIFGIAFPQVISVIIVILSSTFIIYKLKLKNN